MTRHAMLYCRYIKRGSDESGDVANFVETEQLLQRLDHQGCSSFVQVLLLAIEVLLLMLRCDYTPDSVADAKPLLHTIRSADPSLYSGSNPQTGDYVPQSLRLPTAPHTKQPCDLISKTSQIDISIPLPL